MAMYLRGVALIAQPPEKLNWAQRGWYFNSESFQDAVAPIIINNGEERIATVIDAHLWGVGQIYIFEAELPDEDQDADLIVEAVVNGAINIKLGIQVLQAAPRWGSRCDEVLEFDPIVLTLTPEPDRENCCCWLEDEDGSCPYVLPAEVADLRLEYYEHLNEPPPPQRSHEDPVVVPFGEARRIREAADVNEGPVQGTTASLLFLKSRPGEVDLLIGAEGALMALLRLGPEGMIELSDAVDEYFTRFPEHDPDPPANDDEFDEYEGDDPPLEDDEEYDGPGDAA